MESMLKISNRITLSDTEVEVTAVRAQGSGGQRVNKVSTAIHLRFDINASSLPDSYKEKLLSLKDRRISKDGVLIIKAQRFRVQQKNREDAYRRLRELIQSATVVRKKRKPTKPTKGSKKRRLEDKTKRGHQKKLREVSEVLVHAGPVYTPATPLILADGPERDAAQRHRGCVNEIASVHYSTTISATDTGPPPSRADRYSASITRMLAAASASG